MKKLFKWLFVKEQAETVEVPAGTSNGSVSLLFFTELDCYEGTTDRAWQASPKDLASQLDGKADSALTQDQINKLNELNSIVQAELKAKASLSVVNQWVKAYQDFLSTNQENKNKTELDF